MPEETPAIAIDDAEGEALLKHAQEFDSGIKMDVEPSEPEPDSLQEVPDKKEEPSPIEKEPEGEQTEGRDPKTGQFLRKEQKTEGPPAKPQSDYDKARKEAARKEKTWQQIESEKRAVRQEAAAIQAERQRIEFERQNLISQTQPRAKDQHGYSADDYRKSANSFIKDGDYESAFKALSQAEKIEQYEYQWYAQQQQNFNQMAVAKAFEDSKQEAIKQFGEDASPESGSELAQHMGQLYSQYDWLYSIPDSALRVAELAELQRIAMRVPELEAKLAEYEKKNAEKQQRSQPLRGGPTTHGEAHRIEDMDLKEQEAYLERASEEADMSYGLR